ncbi:MAG TPA: tRNA pseudouridine(38-40) synthase TruA, partial [Clostridiales bacterium]|nr:tRNA pseudouridine(38-40) synthase TruA [Clostridiales bacterium]
GELCRALAETLGTPVRVTGCSRTDAGVHAKDFCITIDADGGTIPPDALPFAAARFLPWDISLISAKECDDSFHVRYDVTAKEYLYRLVNRKVSSPFDVHRAWCLARPIPIEGLSLMRRAAAYFIGTQDFSAFTAEGGKVMSHVRTLSRFTVEKQGDEYLFRVRADGFLYHMVRILVGTLVETAFGRYRPEDMREILDSRDRSCAGMTAPPDGLYLDAVFYEKDANRFL